MKRTNFFTRCTLIQANPSVLQNEVKKDFLSDSTIELIKDIDFDKIKFFLIEKPYIDRDFRSLYYFGFSKRYKRIYRDVIRIHLFSENPRTLDNLSHSNYYGYFTLRETPFNQLGKSYLNPSCLQDRSGYLITSIYYADVWGSSLSIDAFPWMQQDGNFAECGHIACWSIMRYYGNKKAEYPDKPLGELLNDIGISSKNTELDGNSIVELSEILVNIGFSVELLENSTKSDSDIVEQGYCSDFKKTIQCYLESGIPVIAGINSEQHSITLVGYEEHTNLEKFEAIFKDGDVEYKCIESGINTYSANIIDAAIFAKYWFVSDDNFFPYKKMDVDPIKNVEETKNIDYLNIDSIDTSAVPLHNKVLLTPLDLFGYILPIIERSNEELFNKYYIRRTILVSSIALKSYAKNYISDENYRNAILSINLPKLVWVIEYSSFRDFRMKQVNHRVIIDSTAIESDSDAIILLQIGHKIRAFIIDKKVNLINPTTPRIKNSLKQF